MEIIIGEKIAVRGYTKDVENWCKDNLILQNPEYYKKQRMGKWTGNTSQYIALYEQRGEWLMLPYGAKDVFLRLFGEGATVQHVFKPIRQTSYKSIINLYPYQKTASDAALEKGNGIIVMPCGSGKTQTGLDVIARIGGRALWLTHTQDLLNQSMNRAKSLYTIPSWMYGTITAGKVNISEGITFATVQTMSKLDLSQYRDAFDVVIVDECQHCCGSPTKVTQFYKVISNLCARYKFGLTATPKRADGLEKSMFALLGGTVHTVTKEDVADTTCPVKVQTLLTGYFPDEDIVLAGDGTLNYAALVEDLTDNDERLHLVSAKVAECAKTGATMVLANRVQYLQDIEIELKSKGLNVVCLSAMGNSKAAKAYRKQVLSDLNDGKLNCVLATYQLAKEGLDCPQLRYVIFATPEKDETTVTQAAGRVGRKADGKEFGMVIDFVDSFGMYRGWAKKRMTVYKKLGYNIIDIY